GPGCYDPHSAQLVMYYGFDAVYFSGYSFEIDHLGTTDMDLYSSVEITDGVRRTIMALRKFQLTMATGDPETGDKPKHPELPAVDAPETKRGLELAIDRGLRYLDSGYPDLLWCEFPTAARGPVEEFHEAIRKRFPDARFGFNYSSSFKWQNEKNPLTFDELGQMGVGFLFITLAMQHAAGYGMSKLLQGLKKQEQGGYIDFQREEWAEGEDLPTKSHHL